MRKPDSIKLRQKLRQLTAAALITVMAVLEPAGGFFAIPVHAAPFSIEQFLLSSAGESRSINLGLGGIATPSSGEGSDSWAGDYVSYGSYYIKATDSNAEEPGGEKASPSEAKKDPVRWRVLALEDGEEAAPLLFSDQILDQKIYIEEAAESVSWKDSSVKEWLDEEMLPELFSDKEQEAVIKTRGEEGSNSNGYTNPAADNHLYLLSYAEASDPAYGFEPFDLESGNPSIDPTRVLTTTEYARDRGADLSTDGRNAWWLRSASEEKGYNMGSIDIDGWPGQDMAARIDVNGLAPAFHLDPEKVLLTSLAEGGKPDGITGELEETESFGNEEGNTWKLTIQDEQHEDFKLKETSMLKKQEDHFILRAALEETIELSYEGAVAGSDERPEAISAILLGKDGEEDLFLYGRLKAVGDGEESGTVRFRLPETLVEGETYGLLVFAEQYNGDHQTDFASGFQTVELTVKEKREIQVYDGAILDIASPSHSLKPATASDADWTWTSDEAYEGYQVMVLADEAPDPVDMGFDRWRTSPLNLKWLKGTTEQDEKAVFEMPDSNVVLTAHYANLASPSEATVEARALPEDWNASVDWDQLDELTGDEYIITPENREKLEKGWHFNLRFTIEKHSNSWSATPSDAFAGMEEEGEELAFYVTTELEKQIRSRDGSVNRTEKLEEAVNEIQVTVPIPEEYQDLSGYRLLGYTAADLEPVEPYEIDFGWQEEGKARVLTFTAAANGVYGLIYTAGDNELRIDCPNITYGDLVEPWIENNPSDGEVTFYYKKQGASDQTAVTEAPVYPGDYTVIAVTEETDDFEPLTARVDFTIRKRQLEDYMIRLEETEYRYKGEPVEPPVLMVDESMYTGENLISQTDYVIRYENNDRAGIGRVVAEALEGGNYRGTAYCDFSILHRGSGSSGGSSSSLFYDRPVNVSGTWQQQPDGTWRFNKTLTGTWAANEWIYTGDQWYYFQENGIMCTGWQLINGAWYYLEETAGSGQGRMRTGWFQDPNDHYWYYLDPVTGSMKTGWLWYEGKLYYLTEQSEAIAGWRLDPEAGKWIFENKNSRPLGAWKEDES